MDERRRGRHDRVGRADPHDVDDLSGPYQLQEASHASYWGQLAMRNCLRLAYNGGAVRGGSCVRVASGLTSAASRGWGCGSTGAGGPTRACGASARA